VYSADGIVVDGVAEYGEVARDRALEDFTVVIGRQDPCRPPVRSAGHLR
jgi:hypothetical protein